MTGIYLDYNATTPIAPAAQQAMLPFLAEQFGNPSSSHALGKAAHQAVEDARTRLAQFLGCWRDEIVFTSGGTEANNLAIKGLAFARGIESRGHLVISALEHPAVVEPARFLERLGWQTTVVGCDRRGVVDPQQVAEAIRTSTVLVSVMHANNEIGTIQPIREIAQICRRRGVLLHTDAAQSAGKIATRVDDLGVDLLTIAGHKLYAPKGVGALYVGRGIVLDPVLHGASHELGRRAGTENVAQIVALGAAAELARESIAESPSRIAGLRDRLQDRLRSAIGERLDVHGADAERLPNTLSVAFPGAIGSRLLARIPELCASTGAACHSGSVKMSSTLAAIGSSPDVAAGTLRLSLGWYTTQAEVDRAAELLIEAAT